MTRPDPWLPGAVLIVAEEAWLLLPLLEDGVRRWRSMGASTKLAGVADLLARWQHLAEQYDERLVSSAVGTPVSGDGADRSDSGLVGPRISASAAAEQLNCSTRWVRRLCSTGELDAHRERWRMLDHPGRFGGGVQGPHCA